MIDDPEKTARLLAELEAALPVSARVTPILRAHLARQDPDLPIPDAVQVSRLHDLGEEGGIACAFELAGPDDRKLHVVSITHLAFDRRLPLYRQIESYQRHRIKKLKAQGGQARRPRP